MIKIHITTNNRLCPIGMMAKDNEFRRIAENTVTGLIKGDLSTARWTSCKSTYLTKQGLLTDNMSSPLYIADMGYYRDGGFLVELGANYHEGYCDENDCEGEYD